jgi:A/G-specific adenine glycosylase
MANTSSQWFSSRVLKWYSVNGRHDLPWKDPISPYRVWVSEIMLQQTQVSTVIPYFIRFMERFPTVHSLAEAPLDLVFHYWAGLGYYARAKNLHRGAVEIVQHFKGKFPKTVEEWISIPGVGRSTAGAIVSQSFDLRAPILDGNVKRVLCRFQGITGWPGEKPVETQLWDLAEKLTPSHQAADYTQAMMDLGAMLCTRARPQCGACPLKSKCYAFIHDKQSSLPERKPAKSLPTKQTHILVLQTHSGHVLLGQRPLKGIWSGLWSFPEFPDLRALKAFLISNLKMKKRELEKLDSISHTFTHYHLEIFPFRILLNKPLSIKLPETYDWINGLMLKERGLPAPIQSLIRKLGVL